MGGAARERVNRMLDDAERAGSCFAPTCEKDRKALCRMGEEVLEPLDGLFARRATWAALTPPEKALHVMRGLAQLHPRWTFCGTSAALAYGLPVTWRHLRLTEVSCEGSRRARQGVRMRRIGEKDVEVVNGLRLTPFWRTVFDCLADPTIALPDALAVVDAALRMSGSTSEQVVAHFKGAYRGRRGVRRAVEVAELADGRAESGGESIARGLMHELGFAAPQLQMWIEDPVEHGRWFRVDFAWLTADGRLVIGEMDGRAKSTAPEMTHGRSTERVLQDERLRESHLTVYQPSIVRFSYDDLRDPGRFERLLTRFGVPRATEGACELPQVVSASAAIWLFGFVRASITLEVA